MKSERRHELQRNSLARWIEEFPTFWRESGSKVMLGIIAILLAIFVYRLIHSRTVEKARVVAESLSQAQAGLSELHNLGAYRLDGTAEQLFKIRAEKRKEIEKYVLDVLASSED